MIDKIDNVLKVAISSRPVERTSPDTAVPKKDALPVKVAAAARMPEYDFQFRVDEETQKITALIVDPETRTVIREIPSEEMRAASDVIRRLIGPLVDKTA
ncbi:MAG: flagellar protein FlaG [Nitrospira sp.]|nr:flagellar protein FlaG [Nitrospira sp.]